jgi:hypothetical protein
VTLTKTLARSLLAASSVAALTLSSTSSAADSAPSEHLTARAVDHSEKAAPAASAASSTLHEELPPPAAELMPPHRSAPAPVRMHPDIVLRDGAGRPVVESSKAVSPLATCGNCHDAVWIASHSGHADLGYVESTEGRPAPSGRPWDLGPGPWGRFDPLVYDLPRAAGASEQLGTERLQWARLHPQRLLGGGPIGDRAEMNCLFCHVATADWAAAGRETAEGRFEWAATATLSGTGLVTRVDSGWTFQRQEFAPDGSVAAAAIGLGRPTDAACGQCHGLVSRGDQPLTLAELGPQQRMTELTGAIFSPRRIRDAQIDIAGRDGLLRSWDVHAQRLVGCSDCHFSPNDPRYVYARSGPEHLRFDPRRIGHSDFLWRPSHQFAAGSAAAERGPGEHGAMRRCEDCHDALMTHGWLPRRERHFSALSCESCHIDQAWAPARRETDYTLPSAPGQARVAYRGLEGDQWSPNARVTGFRPTLLPRRDLDGSTRLFPHNLLTTWLWVGTIAGHQSPVPRDLLERAVFENGRHHSQVLATLDTDGDGRLTGVELILRTPEAVALIANRLRGVGVGDPHIIGEVSAHELHHGVGEANLASRITAPVLLASYLPGSELPRFLLDAPGAKEGKIVKNPDGSVSFVPDSGAMGLYVFGHSRFRWLDWLGLLAVAGGVGVAGTHGLLRWRSARRRSEGKVAS